MELLLKKYTKSKTIAQQFQLRAKILLLSNDDVTRGEIVGLLSTVTLWVNRYLEKGINCILKDRPRGLNQGGEK